MYSGCCWGWVLTLGEMDLYIALEFLAKGVLIEIGRHSGTGLPGPDCSLVFGRRRRSTIDSRLPAPPYNSNVQQLQ